MESDRYTRGWERLKEIDGQAGERVIAALNGIFAAKDVFSERDEAGQPS
jgi:hypothetical protein